jgi:predicted dehydrogenase
MSLLGRNMMAAKSVLSAPTGKRIGMIGLDTGHCMGFTRSFNAQDAGDRYRGYKVTTAYPKGTELVTEWKDRIPQITQEMKEAGVEIVASMEELLAKVDVVLITCIDGNKHLELATPVIKAKKTLFIDKPFTASYKDAIAIVELAKKYQTPMFSSSSLRYMEGIDNITEIVGKVTGADIFSPAHIEPNHPDLFWYSTHGIEMLFAIMGTGCKSVKRTFTPDTDYVVGVWDDNRICAYRGLRKEKTGYGATVFGEKAIKVLDKYSGHEPLLMKIAEFYDSKTIPFPVEQTLEIIAFMEAAEKKKKNGGIAVDIDSVMKSVI